MQGQRIAILGCGPGGMALALFLQRGGHDVCVFERFSAVRPLGSGLVIQPSGQKVFAALGLLDALRSRSARIDSLSGISISSGKQALFMRYADLGGDTHALGVHRATLFNVLHEALVAAAIPIRTGCEIDAASLVEFRNGIALRCCPSDGTFDLVIDAMGARSPLATSKRRKLDYGAFWATVDIPAGSEIANAALDQRYLRARQMAGIMPVGISPFTGNPAAAVFWSARHDEVDAIVEGGLDAWREKYCDLWPAAEPFLLGIKSFDELTFARYDHRTGWPVCGARLFHIGDAWHCTSPQLGQGANMALIDAAAMARAIGAAQAPSDIAPAFIAMRGLHIRLYQALSSVFTPLYQSNAIAGPWLRDQIVHHTRTWRLVNRFVARVVAGDLGNRFAG